MKRFVLPLVLVATIGATGCSSSNSFDPVAAAELLQDCGLEGFLQFLAIFERLGDVIDEIESGIDNEDVTVTPTGTANEWDYTAMFDVDGDGTNDTTLGGTILFDEDPTDGIAPGDTATLSLTQTSGGPDATANLGLTIDPNMVGITGTATITGVSNCNATFTIPVASPLLVAFNDPILDMQLAGPVFLPNFLSFLVTGMFDIHVTQGGTSLMSTVVLDGTNGIQFTNPVVNNTQIDDGFVIIPPGDELFEVASCALNGIFAMDDIAQVIRDLGQAIENGDTQVDGDDFTAVPVPGLLNTFDVTIMGNTALTARVNFPSDPTAGPITGNITLSTWSFAASVTTGGLFLPGTGQSTSPLVLNVVANDLEAYYGSGSFTSGQCTATASIPAGNPLTEDGGEISINAANLLHSLGFRIFSDAGGLFGDLIVTDGTIDGIDVPGELLVALLELAIF